MSAVTDEMVDRLIAAVEGEVDGLAIDAEQATAILAYVLEGALLPAHPEPDVGRVEGWQPIETAPKDGTWIVVYQSGTLAPNHFVCAWDADWANGWWMVCDGKDFEIPLRGPEPTHWQPLPTPPSPPREEEHLGVVALGGSSP